ncbi:MAG: FliH/SctL family protein [Candidatus Saccharibacteria bacterium]
MSSIIKAQRLVVESNYTLVGEEVGFLLDDEEGETNEDPLLTEEEEIEVIEAPPEPTAEEQIADLREETERILKETEEMVVEIMERARGEATVLISNAKDEAQVIMADAQEEAERIKASALDQGHREGLQIAFRETDEQRKKARLESEQLIAAGAKQKSELIQSAEPEIVNLALAVAAKVMAREIKIDPTIILDIVREALKLAGEANNVRVMVNPDDADTVKYFVPQLIEPDQNLGDITIEGDRRIDQGGCLVETEKGIVDARIQTRRFNVEGAVMEGLNNA